MEQFKVILTCRYMDRDYAAINEFDFACTKSVYMGCKWNPLLFDDVESFCASCPIYDTLLKAREELAKRNIGSVIHGSVL